MQNNINSLPAHKALSIKQIIRAYNTKAESDLRYFAVNHWRKGRSVSFTFGTYNDNA